MRRGVALAFLQLLLVLVLVGEYVSDRVRLPQVWTQASLAETPTAVHGHYVQVKLRVTCKNANSVSGGWTRCRLTVENGVITAYPDVNGSVSISRVREEWWLDKPLNFFVSNREFIQNQGNSGRLWAQVTVLPRGDPRPVRLAYRGPSV